MMRPTTTPRDKWGRRVRIGARVRVLKISPWLLARLEAPEKRQVLSMVGEVFKVDEIDEYGSPWVTKFFPRRAQRSNAHSLALDAAEMEVVLANRKSRYRPTRPAPLMSDQIYSWEIGDS